MLCQRECRRGNPSRPDKAAVEQDGRLGRFRSGLWLFRTSFPRDCTTAPPRSRGKARRLNGNTCCGVRKGELVVRVARDDTDGALAEPHTRAFDFTGRPMRGWVVVGAAGCRDDGDLAGWVGKAVAFASSLPAK
jgi:hypothetical protein